MLRLLAGLPLVALSSFAAPAQATEPQTYQVRWLTRTAQNLGVRVHFEQRQVGNCAPVDGGVTFGYYRRYEGSMRPGLLVMCDANHTNMNQYTEIFRHELWHAVQHLCTRRQQTLSDNQIRYNLNAQDRASLRQFYEGSDWRGEAEARAIAKFSFPVFKSYVRSACGHRTAGHH